MPSLEAKRLEALDALEILDTPREERFDRITRTAVRLFRMPKSLLAFVDETRAWVKSDVGTSTAGRAAARAEARRPADPSRQSPHPRPRAGPSWRRLFRDLPVV
jgi:hypothetical protein